MADSVLRIEVKGSGTNIWAYAISDETFARLPELDSQEDQIDLIRDEHIGGGELITWGINLGGQREPKLIVKLKDVTLEIDQLVRTDESLTLEEEAEDSGFDMSTCIEVNETDRVNLGMSLEDALAGLEPRAFLIEATFFKQILLWVDIPINGEFNIRDLRLIVNDMDTETLLSAATYQLGLLDCVHDGEENALIGMIYKGEQYLFECDSYGGQGTEFTLVENTDGDLFENDAILKSD